MQKIPNGLFCKIFNILPSYLLDNLKVLHKFMCAVKISFPVILQMWENKSGAGADPHPFWTWWYFIYTLSSSTLPLNVHIIWSDPFFITVPLATFASVITFVGQTRIVAQWWVWRAIFLVFPTLFFLSRFCFFGDKSDNDGSGSGSSGICAFPFCYGNSVGHVSGIGSEVFFRLESSQLVTFFCW